MARQLRIEYPGALYHVMARGNARMAIYDGEEDFLAFLRILGACVRRRGWVLHAYVMMPNHFHLLLETPSGGLSRGMQSLNLRYASYFNAVHGRVGHLFQGRFKAFLVQREGCFFTLSRYIHLNPVRAGLVERPWDYRWSSCAAIVGCAAAPPWLSEGPTLERFEGDRRARRREYAAFLGAFAVAPPERPRGQLVIGDDDFLAQVRARRNPGAPGIEEFPFQRELEPQPTIARIRAVVSEESRGIPIGVRGGRPVEVEKLLAAWALREFTGLTLKAAGDAVGVGASGVSERLKRVALKARKSTQWRLTLDRIERRLRARSEFSEN